MPTRVNGDEPDDQWDEGGQESDDEEMNDGWGPSAYNDNEGVKLNISFTPILVIKPGEKRRANAKAPVISKITTFHEDFGLQEFIVKMLRTLDRLDLIERSWLYHGCTLDDPDTFSVTYSIPRKVKDPVQVNNDRDFKQMVKEATYKAAAEIKLFVLEHKIADEDSEESEESDGEEDARTRNKRKKNQLSPEEIEQGKVIAALESRYRCEDNSCGMTPCYVAGPQAEHIHLTHRHLRLWSSGIVEKKPGVTLDDPPHEKCFDPARKSTTDDVDLLARRRLDRNREAAAPNITVNFPGFADVFRQPSQIPATPAPLAPIPIPNGAQPMDHRRERHLLPPMELEEFCARYRLSRKISEKLSQIEVTGPNTLHLISDGDLRTEGKLLVGELAAVRVAELCWVEDCHKA